jgi:hypothetical protein
MERGDTHLLVLLKASGGMFWFAGPFANPDHIRWTLCKALARPICKLSPIANQRWFNFEKG